MIVVVSSIRIQQSKLNHTIWVMVIKHGATVASNMPKKKRPAMRPPKLCAAAVQATETPHMNTFTNTVYPNSISTRINQCSETPTVFRNGKLHEEVRGCRLPYELCHVDDGAEPAVLCPDKPCLVNDTEDRGIRERRSTRQG
jgi:hypothetical protein